MVGRPIGLNGLIRREKICLQYVCVRDKPGQAGSLSRVDISEDSPSPIGRGCACFSLLSPSPNRLGGLEIRTSIGAVPSSFHTVVALKLVQIETCCLPPAPSDQGSARWFEIRWSVTTVLLLIHMFLNRVCCLGCQTSTPSPVKYACMLRCIHVLH